MSVYVDPLMAWPRVPRWPYGEVSHLTADSNEELLAFAGLIGLKPSWFQRGKGKLPHFDLTASKRAQAVRAGAVEITRAQMCQRIESWRAKNGSPAEAAAVAAVKWLAQGELSL